MEPLSEVEKEKLRAQARELEQFTTELRSKFDAKHAEAVRREQSFRFFSSNPKYMWRIPGWLWIPLVLFLFGLLAVAFMGT